MSTIAERREARKASMRPGANGELSHTQIMSVLVGLMMGMFLASLDQTIVGTAIRTIADDLQGLSAQAWVTTAYLITSTISTPLYGKLSDIYGRKKFFMAAIAIFIVGSLASAFATTMYQLAAFRAFQGLGAGGLMSLALAIIGDIVPPRERAKYQGYFMAVFGTSSVLGPVIGGFFAGTGSILGITGWRWVFLVNVPIGIVAMVVVWMTLHLHTERKDHSIDWWGATTIIVALVPLLTVLEQGREWGWTSTNALACFAVAALGLIGFIVSEHRAGDEALIPLRIFRNRAISVSIVGSLIIGMGMFGGIMMIPLYLQIVHGASPTMSGLQMLPMTAGIMISSVVAGQLISRTGKIRRFPIIGAVLMLVGFLLMSRIGADSSLQLVMGYMFIFGMGLGMTMQPTTLIVQNAVDPSEIGMATAAATFFRQMGGTIGVAFFTSMLFNSLGDKLSSAMQGAANDPAFVAATKDPAVLADPANVSFLKDMPGALANMNNDSSFLQKIDARLAHPVEVGFSNAVDVVFMSAAVAALIGLVIFCLMPRITLRTSSAAAMSQQTEAAAELAGAPSDGDLYGDQISDEERIAELERAYAADHAADPVIDHAIDPSQARGSDAGTLAAAGSGTAGGMRDEAGAGAATPAAVATLQRSGDTTWQRPTSTSVDDAPTTTLPVVTEHTRRSQAQRGRYKGRHRG